MVEQNVGGVTKRQKIMVICEELGNDELSSVIERTVNFNGCATVDGVTRRQNDGYLRGKRARRNIKCD